MNNVINCEKIALSTMTGFCEDSCFTLTYLCTTLKLLDNAYFNECMNDCVDMPVCELIGYELFMEIHTLIISGILTSYLAVRVPDGDLVHVR